MFWTPLPSPFFAGLACGASPALRAFVPAPKVQDARIQATLSAPCIVPIGYKSFYKHTSPSTFILHLLSLYLYYVQYTIYAHASTPSKGNFWRSLTPLSGPGSEFCSTNTTLGLQKGQNFAFGAWPPAALAEGPYRYAPSSPQMDLISDHTFIWPGW